MTTIHTSPSTAVQGRTNVYIVGTTAEEVSKVINDLADRHSNVSFTLPTRCADDHWACIGRVWDDNDLHT